MMQDFSIADLQRQSIAEQRAKEQNAPTQLADDEAATEIVQEDDELVNKLINQQINKPDNKLVTKRTNNSSKQQVNNPITSPTATARQMDAEPLSLDPLTQAYLSTLSQPFSPADSKSPRVLVAGRVQTEVSERFELACTMLKKKGDKQDVLNKALQIFIEHLVEHQGDIEL